MEDLLSLPIFFISFREALETGIIVSVLLAIVKRTLSGHDAAAMYGTIVRQIWLGTVVGVILCIIFGGVVLFGIRGLASEVFSGAEDIWEATFSLVASLIITTMGAALLQMGKLEDKWRARLSKAMDTSSAAEHSGSLLDRAKYFGEKYAWFILPFVTVLREGFEGVIFVTGVGLDSTPTSILFSVIAGLIVGAFVGFLIYKGSNVAPIQYFLLLSTFLLYLVAAGLFSKGIWHLEANQWNKVVGGDAAELGSGPGSYDIRRSVWHVNCCNPDLDGGGFWGIFNAVLGWQNSATVGSVVSYNVYWAVVAAGFAFMGLRERESLRRTKDDARRTPADREPLLRNGAR
ncbi:high-affinity iron permease [Conoideocrella luteorostrata]|uniref:High-affinity iron permease n=1 Tax=Conoideocrella luteorostrata TaxID=1105319 RepID=A0AAJ0CRZ0_9HYPO|nr:high-affinity iron permease [Conoideocrella luteorostrata]